MPSTPRSEVPHDECQAHPAEVRPEGLPCPELAGVRDGSPPRGVDRARTHDGKLANWKLAEADAQDARPTTQYSNHAIETTVTLGLVFGWRPQTEGFLRSLLTLLNLDNDVPDHSTISRRKARLFLREAREARPPPHRQQRSFRLYPSSKGPRFSDQQLSGIRACSQQKREGANTMKKTRTKHNPASRWRWRHARPGVGAEIARRYKVHANVVYKWKRQLLDNAAQSFETDHGDGGASEREDVLLKKIGELTVELGAATSPDGTERHAVDAAAMRAAGRDPVERVYLRAGGPGRGGAGVDAPDRPASAASLLRQPDDHADVASRMRLMGLESTAPQPTTSTPAPDHPVYPYLLLIARPNQVWATDITYIPMALRLPGGDHRLVLAPGPGAGVLSNTRGHATSVRR